MLSWTEQVQAFGESHRPLLCAGWVHASHIKPSDHATTDDYAEVPRQRLPDDRRLWPPPTQPDVGWPDRWYVGVLDGGELPLPLGCAGSASRGRRARWASRAEVVSAGSLSGGRVTLDGCG